MSVIQCESCGATWEGEPDDPCYWCAKRHAIALDQRKHELLYPKWMEDQGRRYWELSDDISREVWDRTRGIVRNKAVQEKWADDLEEAYHIGMITEAELLGAIARCERMGPQQLNDSLNDIKPDTNQS